MFGFFEKRKFKRLTYNETVTISKNNNSSSFEAKGDNISEGGIAIKSTFSLNVGEQVIVEIQHKLYDAPLKLKSQVQHEIKLTNPADTNMIGLKFHKVSKNDNKKLMQLLSELTRLK